MEIKECIYATDNIVKAVIKSDSGNEYTVSFDGDTSVSWCTCPAYILGRRNICKHQLFLLDNLDFALLNPMKKYGSIQSECSTIDLIMGDGFPLKSISAIFGESGQGKTLLTAQLALSCIKNLNRDVIIIETEGNREQDFLELLYRFKERWGLNEELISEKIQFIPVIEDFRSQSKAIIDLLKLVGYEAEIEQSPKGDKYTTSFKDCKPGIKEDILSKSGLLIIDSLTKPLKASIGHKTQNLPARAELVDRLFARLWSIACDFNLAIVINHHAVVNKALPFTRDFGDPYGGGAIFYNSKYIIELINSDMAARNKYKDCKCCGGAGAKRVMLIKHPYHPISREMFPIHLKTNYGFTDDI